MGIYSHISTEQLRATRDNYVQALTERLTGPSRVAVSGKSVSFNDRAVEYQRTIDDLKKEIARINAELAARGIDDSVAGSASTARGPIYLVGR